MREVALICSRGLARASVVLGVALFALGGCGDDGAGSKRVTSTAPPGSAGKPVAIGAPSTVGLRAGLLGAQPSAGVAAGYVPTGAIVADSGFRPQQNGFSFENYGNDAGPVNMTAQNVEDIFGAQVCQSGEGASCVLIPQARYWMKRVNASMANGHCMGFSVTALRFFSGNAGVPTFGATQTIALPVRGNTRLQSLIAEDFAYQDLPAVTNRAVQGTPVQVLGALVSALRGGREQYTLAILKADGTGGHAITPFAVEDRGHGQMAILVYDNNFPGVVRKVDVDTGADTWHYVGGVNPSNTNAIYAGDARTKSMALLPTTPGERQQPCPFCPATPGEAPGAKPSVVDKLHYVEVALTDRGAEHPHLLFADPQGRHTGYLNGRLVNEIPGMQVIQSYSVQNWIAAPEPTYHLPLGHPAYTVTVDGAALSREIKTQLQVNGAGLVFDIKDIRIAPGQKDTLLLPGRDLAVSYASGSKFPGSPTIGVQFPQFIPGSTKARLITMATGSIGFAPGSPVTLVISPASGTAYLNSVGATPLVASARYVLSVDSAPINGGLPEHYYLTDTIPLDGNRSQVAHFAYLAPTTAQLPVDVLDQRGHSVRRVLVPGAK